VDALGAEMAARMTDAERAALVARFVAAVRVDTGYTLALARAHHDAEARREAQSPERGA